jgi:ubiquinone biosynthesis protein UbiJ
MSRDDLIEKLKAAEKRAEEYAMIYGQERLAMCRKEVDDLRAQLARLSTFELMATNHRRCDE